MEIWVYFKKVGISIASLCACECDLSSTYSCAVFQNIEFKNFCSEFMVRIKRVKM